MAMMIERQDLEISLLRTFLAVVLHGSMGRTATAVARTQPAVSQQMLRLEKIIGRKLFYRSRNGVKLTGHGELLVTFANRAIDLNDEALAQLREESTSGPLNLGVSEQTALAGLTPKRFQRTQTDVDLKFVVGAPAKLAFLLTKARDLVEMALTTSIEDAAGSRPVQSLEAQGPPSDEGRLSSRSRLLELRVSGL